MVLRCSVELWECGWQVHCSRRSFEIFLFAEEGCRDVRTTSCLDPNLEDREVESKRFRDRLEF